MLRPESLLRPAILLLLLMAASAAFAQTVDTISPDLRGQVDRIATQVLQETGVPSASVAVVQHGKLVYTHAYGFAHLATDSSPAVPATPEMRYSIGSISKQFTATAILLLQEQGKLSLDDPVGKYVPGLTRGDEVTIREILSHTSGYQDYWPEDYVMTPMLNPETAQQIIDTWAKKPLDFEPGHAVAVLQHQLRHRRTHRRDCLRRALLEFPHRAHLPPAGHEVRMELRPDQAHTRPTRRLLPSCPWPLAHRSQRRQRLDVCRRRTGHDTARPGALGRKLARTVTCSSPRATRICLPR